MRFVKAASELAREVGFTEQNEVYPAAFGRLSTTVEVFLSFADNCEDLELLKKYIKQSFEAVTDTFLQE